MERDLISERTRSGLESARARSGGRPKKDNRQVEKALKLYNSQYTIKEIEEMTSVSKAILYREIRSGKVKRRLYRHSLTMMSVFFYEFRVDSGEYSLSPN
jgi:DNA invertase Pin-like site-specific DNA recombinase